MFEMAAVYVIHGERILNISRIITKENYYS